MSTSTMKMTIIGTLSPISAAENGTSVATMARTSSMQGMASMTFIIAPLNGNVKMRSRFGSFLRRLRNAGNIGM